MTISRIAGVCVASVSCFVACTHVVGFDPVAQPRELGPKTRGSVRFYMAPEIKSASHSFSSFWSGVGNEWVVDYGARAHEFAVIYLAAGFTDFQELGAPGRPAGAEVLVTIENVGYVIRDQAAHVSMDVEASDAAGSTVLSKHYAKRGWSGGGAVFGGGAFAQEGVTRSSTDQAFKEMFLAVIEDLRSALED